MKLPEPHEDLPSELTPGDVIEIQIADPEKGSSRIQAHMVPGGMDLLLYPVGDTDPIAVFLTTAGWQKMAAQYVQCHPEQLRLVEEMLQQRREPVRPKYLAATLHRTQELSNLLYFLNTRSEPQHGIVRELVDELITNQGMTPHIVELFQNHSTKHAFHRIRITVKGIDHHFETPVFASIAPALLKLFDSRDSWRLKCCVECETYFFDATRNGKQRYCSKRCTSRRTSRGYYARRRDETSLPA